MRDSYGSYPIKPTTPLDTVVNNTDPYITGINDWSEDYYYQSKKLRRVTTSDGHLNFYDSPDHTTYYTTKDHIGCTWQRKVGSRNALMYPNYYPSGIMDLKPYTTYPFGLGGKEFMSTNYLDEYYFGARTMYAIMNRFNQVDPLCEEYYSVSPYAYALNNPVRYKDPTGKYVESAWDIASLAMGVKSFVNNVQGGNIVGAIVDGVGIVLDAAAVALPVIPGGAGAAIKGVRAIDKAVDTAKTADKAVDGVSAMKRGIQNEAKVLESIGEVKNTAKKTVTLPGTREKVTVIPDTITDTKIIEIKDVKSLSNTKQIRGERQVAQGTGKDFTIITGEKTHVSGNIPTKEIRRRNDIGPQ